MKHILKLSLLIPGLFMAAQTKIDARMKIDEYFTKMHQRHVDMIKEMDRMYESMWKDFDGLLDESKKDGKKEVAEVDVVTLPDVDMQPDKDNKSLTLIIKGITAKKDAVKIDYEDRGMVTAAFPHLEGTATLKIYPRGMELEAEKKIVEEKKDEKGKVLGSSSYKAYNVSSQTFPFVVNVASIKKHHPQFKDGALKLTFDVYETKEAIAIE